MKPPSHAERARTLIEHGRMGTLATLALDPAGFPFGSLVAYALEPTGDPLLLTSSLAEHTHNFKADPRASLLVSEGALMQGRVTLLGEVHGAPNLEQSRERYLERHPEAAQYIDFKDFQMYRLEVESIRYVGGFGRMSWVDLADYRKAEPDPLAPHAQDILEHMNEDHQGSMLLLAQHQAGVRGSRALMLEVDRYGYELSIDDHRVRLEFSQSVSTPDEVRKALVKATHQARQALK